MSWMNAQNNNARIVTGSEDSLGTMVCRFP